MNRDGSQFDEETQRRWDSVMKPDFGRPTLYTKELAAQICDLMCSGMSLRKICLPKEMPSTATVFGWLLRYPDFLDQYQRAQAARSEAMMDEFVEIADNPADHSFRTASDPSGAQHRKLQLDARKWAISKLNSKRYGDKVETTHAGAVEINQITRKVVDPNGK